MVRFSVLAAFLVLLGPRGFAETKNTDVHEVVVRHYREVLKRAPDPSGLETFTRALQEGKDEAWLRRTLSQSPEAQTLARNRRRRRIVNALFLASGLLLLAVPPPLRLALRPVYFLLDATPGGPFSWKTFCAMLAGLFFLRGLLLLCLFPPLEGFDEHQHIAYLVHLEETGEVPVYGRDRIPASLHPFFAANPHSTYGWRQVRHVGGRRYRDFWDVPPADRVPPESDQTVFMSSSFHPPLYYLVAAPVFDALRTAGGFRTAVYGLRILNLAFAAGAMFLFALPFASFFRSPFVARFCLFALSLAPMLPVYVTRVSADAPALFVKAAVFALLAGFPSASPRGRLLRALAAGGMLGGGVWVRASVIPWIPLAAVFLLICARRSGPPRALATSLALMLGVAGMLSAPLFLHNLDLYGQAIPGQEGVRMAAAGTGMVDLWREVRWEDVSTFFFERMIRQNLWTGGWLFLRPHPALERLYAWTVLFMCAGGLFGLIRRRGGGPGGDGASSGVFALSLLAVVFTLTGAYLHALTSRAAYGHVVTPPYYFMPAFPLFLALAFRGSEQWPHPRTAPVFATLLSMLFLGAELHSTLWIAAPAWAHSRELPEILRRLASVHPVFPAPVWLGLLIPLSLGLLWMLAAAIRQSVPGGRDEPATRGAAPSTR